MKHFYKVILMTVLLFSESQAQTWNIKQQGVTKGFVREMFFLDANTGFATSSDNVGGAYPIFKTTNGGTSWTSYLTSCSNAIYGITFPNANTGYCCSFNGEVAKTTNGGVNWTEVYQNASNWDLDGIEFFDANTGFATAGTNFYVRTTNGGTSWSEPSSTVYGKASCQINSTTAVFAGLDATINGVINKTTNSGASFSSVVVSAGTSNTLYGVYFYDANTGFVGGQGGILSKTTNGGTSWTPLTAPVSVNIYSFCFLDANTGFLGGSSGSFYRTTNGGTNWTAVTVSPITSQTIYDIHFFNATNGIASASVGTFYKTTDGGLTWNAISLNVQLNDIAFINSSTGFAVGNSSFLEKTTNGGTNWSIVSVYTTASVNLFTINFPNSSTGYIGGTNGKLIKTTNGGTTWDSIASGSTTTMQSMDFVDGNTGYIGTFSGIVKKTTDAGGSWTDYSVGVSITSNGISFPDVNTGYICSSSGAVRKTTNAGVNWVALTSGTTQTLNSIYFVDANTGYAAGAAGTIIKTVNGGTNWTNQTTGITDQINSIKFNDASRGMAACNAGKILVTTNGGSSWSSQTSNVLDIINLRGAFIESGNNLYMIGQNGVILNSTDQPLPVELSFFNSSVTGRDVKLSWGTVSEQNNSGFTIERKNSNGMWNEIGFVNGNGTTNQIHSYSFYDRNLSSGNYSYRLKQIDFNGNYEYKNLNNEVIIGKPSSFELSQNYPNPFNPSTKINFQISSDSKVELKVFDISGKEVAVLVNDVRQADYYTVDFNASGLPSGIYFARLNVQSESGAFTKSIKLNLLK